MGLGFEEGLIALTADIFIAAVCYGIKRHRQLQVCEMKNATAVCDDRSAREFCKDGSRYVHIRGELQTNSDGDKSDPEPVYSEITSYEVGERFDKSKQKWIREKKNISILTAEKQCGISRTISGSLLRSHGKEFISIRKPTEATYFSSLMKKLSHKKMPRTPSQDEKVYRVVEMGEVTKAVLTGSLLTIFAELEVDGNELILKQPSFSVGPFVISKLFYKDIIQEFESSAHVCDTVLYICFGVGVLSTLFLISNSRNSDRRD